MRRADFHVYRSNGFVSQIRGQCPNGNGRNARSSRPASSSTPATPGCYRLSMGTTPWNRVSVYAVPGLRGQTDQEPSSRCASLRVSLVGSH